MTTRRVFITDTPHPGTELDRSQAAAAGAAEILHGIPPALAELIPAGTLGAFDIATPDPPTPGPAELTAEERIAELEAILAELLATIGGQ